MVPVVMAPLLESVLVLNYLERVAEKIRQEVSPDTLPTAETKSLFRLSAVPALAKGEQITLADGHNAWSAWMIDQDPTRESLQPFDELAPELQQDDQPLPMRCVGWPPRVVIQRDATSPAAAANRRICSISRSSRRFVLSPPDRARNSRICT